MRWGFALPALAVAVLVALFVLLPSPCPIELKELNSEPIEIYDDAGEKFLLTTWSVRNCTTYGLLFDNCLLAENKVARRWLKVPDRWRLGSLAPSGTGQVLVLVAPGAQACRFRLKYCYRPPALPLGIGDTWARMAPPSALSAQVQRLARRVSLKLYDRLWPPRLSWVRSPRWTSGWTRECTVGTNP